MIGAPATTYFKFAWRQFKMTSAKFQKLLPIVATDGSLKLNDVYEWPVFKLIRKHSEFAAWVKDAFGTNLLLPHSRTSRNCETLSKMTSSRP